MKTDSPSGLTSVTLTYDALGRMVEQARGTSYTQIVYGPQGNKLALMNGQTLTKAFVPLPAGATAVYAGMSLSYYRHADWQGSSRFASTPTTRTKYYSAAYAPYGENYAESGTTDRNFTGQNQDTTADLYDFMFREYNYTHGRWISPDPLGGDIFNPQSFNRYAYVLNSPTNLTDPFGLWARCDATYACYPTGREGGQVCYLISAVCFEVPDEPDGARGGGGGNGGSTSCGNRGISQQKHDDCAQQAFGKTEGLIPGTDKTIPGLGASTDVLAASSATGVAPEVVGATLLAESNGNLAQDTVRSAGSTVDVGPMQLNYNPGKPGRWPSAALGTNLRPGQLFNGDAYQNILAGAGFLNSLGGHPENYVGKKGATDRLNFLNKMESKLKPFFDCLAGR